MKNKIKKGWQILRRDGVVRFTEKALFFLAPSACSVVRNILLKNKSDVVRLLRGFSSNDPEETFSFARGFFAEAFRPIQIQEEFLKLLGIFKKAEPKVVMEIGTANGGTLFCFSKLAPDDATIISVDLPEGKFGGGYPEWKVPLYQAFAKDGQDLHLLRKDSHAPETLEKIKKILVGRQVDFLFIDGDHAYEGVKKDFEMYSPLVRKGGVVVFHDVAPNGSPELTGGVPQFYAEVMSKYKNHSVGFVRDRAQMGYGIGVLFL